MDRIWVKHYPAGVPADVDAGQYPSLVALFEESFAKYKNANAYACMDKKLTYAQLDEMSRALGAWLQSKGLQRGDRVAIMMPNVLQYPVCVAGILRAGFVVVNVNPLYTPRELEHQLKDSGAKAIIIIENFAKTLEQVLAKTPVQHIVLASMGDLLGFPKGTIVNMVVRKVKKMVPAFSLPGATKFNDAIAAGRRLQLAKPDIKRDDVAFLQYTGGTTGVSKGATLLHRNVIANVLQNEAWLQPALKKGKQVERMTIVTALPLYHIFALTACCLLGMRIGAMCLLIPNPRDIPGFIKELGKYEFHMLPAVNTLYNGLLNNPEFAKLDFSGLKAANGGGMAVQRAVAERFFKLTGVPIIEGYGLSETAPTLTCNRADNTEYTGTIGLPVPSTEISIRDDDGKEVALGEPGEICAQGPPGDGRLLAAARGDRQRHDGRRLLQDRRHRGDGCRRPGEDRRPQEGHGAGVGLQRVPQRGRGRGGEPPGRAGVRRGRRARCGLGRGGGAVRGQEGPGADRAGADEVLRRAAHGLQEAQVHHLPAGAAQDQRRQGAAPRTARRRPQGHQEGGLNGITCLVVLART